jgi:hypothetical protein
MSRSTPREAVFRHEGEYWTITHQSLTFRLRDTVGLGYLARLFREPDRELHALDLAGAGRAEVVTAGDAGPMLDGQARSTYRRRLTELAEDLEEAREWNDLERADRAEREIDALTEQLAAAVGLGGRDRKAASQAERARVSVTKAIKAGIRRIARYDARLGEHLRHSVRTGTFCSYAPDPAAKITWIL